MKVSEKSLELNVGAELLALLRGPLEMPKAYLRGLTQREESQEGVDFFAQMTPETRVFAFQFKAPKGHQDGEPYRFTIQRRQHEKLSELARGSTGNVFYVLPYYVHPVKLQDHVPNLLADTWFLPVGSMSGTNPFGSNKTKTLCCEQGLASINPEHKLRRAEELDPGSGIPVGQFAEWYTGLHIESDEAIRPEPHRDLRRVTRLHTGSDETIGSKPRRNPWLVRGLRVAIVQPAGEQKQ